MGASGLGKILLHEGLIEEKNLKIIEKTCRQTQAGIAKAILMIGLLDEEELASLLVERTQYKRIPRDFIAQHTQPIGHDPDQRKTDPSYYLALPFIEFLEVYPYDIHNGRLDVVMLDPLDYGVSHQVEFFSGHPVRPHIASHSELTALLASVLPDFKTEEPNLQDFLVDYSVSSAQTLLRVGPPTSPPPAAAYAAPANSAPTYNAPAVATGASVEQASDAILDADPDTELDPLITDDVDRGSPITEDLDIESDLNQDVMDIFDEASDSNPSNALSDEELDRMGMTPDKRTIDSAIQPGNEPQEASAPDEEAEFGDEGLIEAAKEESDDEPEIKAEVKAEAETTFGDDHAFEDQTDDLQQESGDELNEELNEELNDTPNEELSADAIDDITPDDELLEDAEDAITPVEGAVRALNEGLVKLSLGIGGGSHKAAAATLAKIAPEGKLVRVGGEAGDQAEVLNWQESGEFELAEDGAAEVIDLVARRTEGNLLEAPKGWLAVDEPSAGPRQSTGYVPDDGKTGLYLVADLEESFCSNPTFSDLSQKFLKLLHQKWAS